MTKQEIGDDSALIVRNLEGQYQALRDDVTVNWPGTLTNAAASDSIEVLRSHNVKILAVLKRLIETLQG